MRVVLTGGTGYIGGAVLTRLVEAGHDVTALVRSDEAAQKVRAAGATPAVGSLTDVAWTTERFAAADAAVHLAAPSDSPAVDVDRAVTAAAAAAYAGTGKTFVHTGGIWTWGSRDDIAEEQEADAPALTAWRGETEAAALAIDGARTLVVSPGIVYGHGGGIPNLVVSAPRTGSGALTLIGDGEQHWTTVHVDDVADLYLLVVEDDAARGRYVAVNGENPTVRELGEAAARAADLPGVEPSPLDAVRERLGTPFADALFLDQQATGAKARALGWTPSRPSLVTDLEKGSYAG